MNLINIFGSSETARILRNILILSSAFLIFYTAFHGTTNLQSSINADAALGSYTLFSIYVSLIMSNILLPVLVVRWLGCKWTIALSFIAYMPYIAAQFYPSFYTLIPAGILVGVGGGPLLCAKCTYLTILAEAFSVACQSKIKKDVLIIRFFGVFFVFYQMAQVWGNLISSSVLSIESELDIQTNITLSPAVDQICGANFCPGLAVDANPNLTRPPDSKINMLTSIYLCCMIVAFIIVVVLVDSSKRYDRRIESENRATGLGVLALTFKHLIKPYQVLLIPITLFLGAEIAFISGDFTSAFVACGWGIPNIGYAMICYGVTTAITSMLVGALTQVMGRFRLMIGAFLIHCGLLIFMFSWSPVAKDVVTYCLIAAVWGFCEAFWTVQINSMSGILFPGDEETAFSTFRLLEATGSAVTYAILPLLCTGTKLIILFFLLIIGIIGYGTVEYLHSQNQKSSITDDNGKSIAEEVTTTRF